MSKKTKIDLSKVFDQYLRDIRIPEFTYSIKNNELKYKWTNVVSGFNMPVKIYINGVAKDLKPTTDWKIKKVKTSNIQLKIDENYFVVAKQTE